MISAAPEAPPCSTWPDDRLMAQVKSGSADAFSVLYDRYYDRAYRVARSVCRDDGRAEEAVQEAFVSMWRTRLTYDVHAGMVTSWVLTVARHRAIDVARRNDPHAAHRAGEDELRSVATAGGVAEQVLARARAHDVGHLLDRLPLAQAEAIVLAFYGQLTHEEIAARLELPLGTVKGRIRLGLGQLRGDIGCIDM